MKRTRGKSQEPVGPRIRGLLGAGMGFENGREGLEDLMLLGFS